MTSLLMRPVRQLAQVFAASDSPRQVAAGFTLGMIIGLLPKGNLVVLFLTLVLCAVRINKPAGLMAMAVFSLVGPLLDGLAHQLGGLVLIWEAPRPYYVWLNELPMGPWLALNNTVVVGQLLIGLYLAYPTYWFVHRFAGATQARITGWLMRFRLIRWLRGAELGAHWGVDT